MKHTQNNSNWHDITSLQVATTRAILKGDKRAEQVLRRILTEEERRG
jgi:hypothetical protein